MQRAVFFDRDGTLIEEVNYIKDPKDVAVFPGVAGALGRLKKAGFKNIIVTNQSGIGRGWVTPAQYEAVQAAVLKELGGGLIDATYFCPDVPGQESTHRKPLPGMILQAADEHELDLAGSFIVGDNASDILCGRAAGIQTILLLTGHGRKHTDCSPDYIAQDVVEAVDYILKTSL